MKRFAGMRRADSAEFSLGCGCSAFVPDDGQIPLNRRDYSLGCGCSAFVAVFAAAAVAVVAVSFAACASAKSGRNAEEPFYLEGVYAHAGEALTFDEPADSAGYLDRAVAFNHNGRYQEAVADCTKAFELEAAAGTPESAAAMEAVGTRALAYLNAHDTERARADIDYLGEHYFDGTPKDAWIFFVRARINSLEGDEIAAGSDYASSVALDPGYGARVFAREPFYFYGLVGRDRYYANGGAAASLDEPESMLGFLDRAAAYIYLRRYAEAIADCNRALELIPDYPLALGTRALAYRNAGEREKEARDLDFLIENYAQGEPADAWLFYMKGDRERAINLDPDYARLP